MGNRHTRLLASTCSYLTHPVTGTSKVSLISPASLSDVLSFVQADFLRDMKKYLRRKTHGAQVKGPVAVILTVGLSRLFLANLKQYKEYIYAQIRK